MNTQTTDTNTIALRLCPRCRKQVAAHKWFTTKINNGKTGYGIICLKCGWATKAHETAEAAAQQWNDDTEI